MTNEAMHHDTIERAICLYKDIQQYIAEHGRPPVIREILVLMDVKSTATAVHYLGILRKWGWIEDERGTVRCIRLTRPTERIVEVRKPRRKAKSRVA